MFALIISWFVFFIGSSRILSKAYATSDIPKLSGSHLQTSLHNGLNFDQCVADLDCKVPRICAASGSMNLRPCENRAPCHCIHKFEEFVVCNRTGDCEQGEVCISLNVSGMNVDVCTSRTANILGVLPSIWDGEQVPSTGSGRNGEDCRSNDDCKSPRKCIRFSEAGRHISFCRSLSGCECLALNPFCSMSSDCDVKEVCRPVLTDLPLRTAMCVVENYTGSLKRMLGAKQIPRRPEQWAQAPKEITGGCVDVGLLQHLQQDQLVYRTHRWARVLCDSEENCATPGHMVVYKRRPMMMSTYCDMVACSSRMSRVNSPRYRVGLLIKSNTEDLWFSTFAVRYGSGVEEKLLEMAVRVGL